MNHYLAASTLVKVINILGYDSKLGNMPSKLSDCMVCPIGLRPVYLPAAPLVPSPAQTWVGEVGLWGS
ncbi:hypothetical protein D3C76_1370500 [compost metagenome]